MGVSGGVVDGAAGWPFYRYGGMWKNKHEAVSARIKGKAKRGESGKGESAPKGELGREGDLS